MLKKVDEFEKTAVNSAPQLAQTSLMKAVLNNNLSETALLLESGLSPNDQDNNSLSPFIAAAANGYELILELLLLYPVKVEQVNRFGGTALLPSSEKGYLRIVQLALDAGVPVNHVNRLGWTALLEAIILGDGGYLYQDVVRELLNAQADISFTDFEGKDAITYATIMEQEDVLKLLNKEGATKYNKVRHLIREQLYVEAIKEVAKTDINNDGVSLYYLGYCYEKLGRLKDSKKCYEKGLEKDTQFIYYLAMLAKISGNSDEALAYFNKGIKQTNTYFYRYHKSNYLRELGRHDDAIKEMVELLEEHPKRVDFMFHQANSLKHLGRLEEAEKVLKIAAKLMPKNDLFEEEAQKITHLIGR